MKNFKTEIIQAIKENAGPSQRVAKTPYGQILSPLPEALTDTVVDITGETENIEDGQYIYG